VDYVEGEGLTFLHAAPVALPVDQPAPVEN
jgi:hypothetical protein